MPRKKHRPVKTESPPLPKGERNDKPLSESDLLRAPGLVIFEAVGYALSEPEMRVEAEMAQEAVCNVLEVKYDWSMTRSELEQLVAGMWFEMISAECENKRLRVI